ncbi:hypothetical protein [Salinarimonas soli]|uniref:DUF3551 domain-containing protein n=1 Tax=Salinarimonas soli TaxID=1638099 RepID=A0A5B2VH02_9HYPH|nr:hypothetical protein [Salinarimonas soli]KAA2237457.1 hypothetical protein F0L46_10710 [Salinarimonas soli]
MRRTVAILGFSAIVAACTLSFLVLPNGASRAAATASATFLIPASDGYGVADCLASGAECGQVIATAWCEAQGFVRAEAFGPSRPEDVTGTTPAHAEAPATARPIAITCGQ